MQFFTLFIRQNQPAPAFTTQVNAGHSLLAAELRGSALTPAAGLRSEADDEIRRVLDRVEAVLCDRTRTHARSGRLWNRLVPQGEALSQPKRSA